MKIKEDQCPKCGYRFDAVDPVPTKFVKMPGRDKPIAGDRTLCINCATLLEYGPDLKVCLADERQLKFWERAEVQRVRRAILETHREYGPPPSMRDNQSK